MTIDTNIVIAYLNGDEVVRSQFLMLKKMGISLILSSIVEMETLSYPKLTTSDRKEIDAYLEDTFTSISFDRTIAKIGASLRRKYKIAFADAAIAATALYTRTPLITRNVKDFKKILDLKIIEI